MICPRCGSWIDEGEPHCPGCLWDGNDYDEELDTYIGQKSNSYSHTYNQGYNSSNEDTNYTHTINNNTQRIENDESKKDDICNPLTCCCGGILFLWIIGTIGSFLGL